MQCHVSSKTITEQAYKSRGQANRQRRYNEDQIKNTRIGEGPLASKCPDLINCAGDKQGKVENYMDRSGMSGQITWSPTLRRNLSEGE